MGHELGVAQWGSYNSLEEMKRASEQTCFEVHVFILIDFIFFLITEATWKETQKKNHNCP